jgi:hypothetical protein
MSSCSHSLNWVLSPYLPEGGGAVVSTCWERSHTYLIWVPWAHACRARLSSVRTFRSYGPRSWTHRGSLGLIRSHQGSLGLIRQSHRSG